MLALPSSLATCSNYFDSRYFDWKELPEEFINKDDLWITKNILIFINAEELSDSFRAKIKDTYYPNEYEKAFMKDLKSLIDPAAGCTRSLIIRVLQICLILDLEAKDTLNGFAKFFVNVARKKFGEGTLKMAHKLEVGSDVNRYHEERLDEFFANCFPVREVNDTTMLQALLPFDWTRCKSLNLENGARVLGKRPTSEVEALAMLDELMSESCHGLQEGRVHAFHTAALATAFRYRFSSKISKLIEYYRLCFSPRGAYTNKHARPAR